MTLLFLITFKAFECLLVDIAIVVGVADRESERVHVAGRGLDALPEPVE